MEETQVINAAIVKDRKVLLVRKHHGAIILPGGKIDAGESHIACLERELGEELPGTMANLQAARTYCEVRGTAPSSRTRIHAIVYLIQQFDCIGRPSREIKEMLWINRRNLEQYRSEISNITIRVIDSLIRDSYV